MLPRLISSAIRQSPRSVLLLGPRQVGKSTLILNLGPHLIINLNDDKTYLDFTSVDFNILWEWNVSGGTRVR
jgi:uncharacterized protein